MQITYSSQADPFIRLSKTLEFVEGQFQTALS